MKAPTYPPAARFETPAPVIYETLSADILSLADMMSAPAVWAIVLKHAPMFKFTVTTTQLKPYLSNFTFETFANLGLVSPQAIDAINQELRALPRSEWPAL
jgi:hypothetical protein